MTPSEAGAVGGGSVDAPATGLPTARHATRSAMWVILDAVSQTLASILSFLIVARILGPTDFGYAALSFGIYQIVNLFVEILLQDAVVQRAGLTRLQTNSAFWWAVGSGGVGVALLMVTAPLFADMMNAPPITNLLRIMSLGLLCTGVGAVPVALLRRSLSFKSLTKCSIATRLATAGSSAGLAVAGAGAYSLVAQTTIGPLLLTVLVLRVSGWRPSLEFSWRDLRALLVFGIHNAGSQLVWLGSLRIYMFCIGFLFSPTALGFYNIAQRVVDTGRDTIGSAVAGLSVPILSRLQHDHVAFRRAVRQGTELLCLLVLPIFAIIGGCAIPLVHLLLTDKWLAAVPIIQLFAASAMLHFFRYMQTPAITASGRPDIGLMLNVLASVVSFSFLFIFGRHSFFLAASGWAFVRLLVLFPVTSIALKRTIGLPVRSQVIDSLGVACAALAAGITAYVVSDWVGAALGANLLGDCAAIAAGGTAALLAHLLVIAIISRQTLVMAYGVVMTGLKRQR